MNASGSRRLGQLSQNAKQPDSDDVEADYYRHAQDDEYNLSEERSVDVSDEDDEGDEGTLQDGEEDEGDVEEDEEDVEDESEEDDEEDTLTSEVFKVRVLSDFDGEMANDLSIKTGDILTIKELRKDGWWLAEDASGNIGVVPKTLVERIPNSPTPKPRTDKTTTEAAAVSEAKMEKSRSGAELWGKVKEKKLDKKTSVTDVLKAMGAMPSGFRKPTLGNFLKEEEHRIGAWIYPKLTQSNLAFRDLHWDPVESKLRKFPVRITRHCSILSARMVPRVGTGVGVVSRQIHVALWDGKHILSNVHTIRTSSAEKDLVLWNVVKNPQMSIFDADFLVRSNSQLANIGILFELTVSFIRAKTGERSDVSCGWCVLKLFQETGAPTENKNWELPLNGGTPYDSNIELDPSAESKVTGGLMQSLIKVNRQPRLVVKLAPVTKIAKEQYDLLPETVVTAVQYAPFIARYREILADELVQNVDCINQTDLIPDPVLSTFPRVLSQHDLMDALKISWDERAKKSLRQSMRQRDRQERKSLFRSVYMNTVIPLVKLVSLPPLAFANPEIEEERSRIIQDFLARRETVGQLLSDEFSYKPFNLNRMCFDIISKHSVVPG